jgi:glutamine amidotransferase
VIGILDYGIGNPRSILRMCETSGLEVAIVKSPSELDVCRRLILPGVGHFDSCSRAVFDSGLGQAVMETATESHMPILGICVGAQLLGYTSEEGSCSGLELLEMKTLALPVSGGPIPHIGWETIEIPEKSPLNGLFDESPRFYFTHSYTIDAYNKTDIAATFQFGQTLNASVWNENVLAVQFHPEKSHRFGRKLMEWFARWDP